MAEIEPLLSGSGGATGDARPAAAPVAAGLPLYAAVAFLLGRLAVGRAGAPGRRERRADRPGQRRCCCATWWTAAGRPAGRRQLPRPTGRPASAAARPAGRHGGARPDRTRRPRSAERAASWPTSCATALPGVDRRPPDGCGSTPAATRSSPPSWRAPSPTGARSTTRSWRGAGRRARCAAPPSAVAVRAGRRGPSRGRAVLGARGRLRAAGPGRATPRGRRGAARSTRRWRRACWWSPGRRWAGSYAFPHELMRDALRADLSGLRLRSLHLQGGPRR